jgi:biopolymer transport protein ExbD
MAMAMKSVRGRVADMHVRPMIQVLLVLLSIFTVMAPGIPQGLSQFAQ